VINSIFWGGTSQFDSVTGTIKNSDVYDGLSLLVSTECVSSDPLFASIVEGTPGFLRLSPGSPCMDTGTSIEAPAYDIDGLSRPQGYGWDMGAYETEVLPPQISNVKVDGINISEITYTSRNPVIEAAIFDEYSNFGLPTAEVIIGGISYIAIPVTVEGEPNTFSIICTAETQLGTGNYEIVIYATNAYGKRGVYRNSSVKVTDSVDVIGKTKNIPNPFRPSHGEGTTILYTLSTDSSIKLLIYDITGKAVFNRAFSPGSEGGKIYENHVYWDGRTDFGGYAGNGAYIYMIISQDKILAKGQLAIAD
jgi:hypothetical protein